ncbi:MAG: carbohydrate kinase [Planctomycetaceae bacterium]|nr:carbohydrate kinase [Planctomycetaceae bacterium]
MFLSIGEVLWDLLPSGAKPGGAPVNFAYHAQVLGAKAAFVSAVGTDSLGDDLLAFFRTIGLSVELVQRINGSPTGTVGVELGPDGQPKFTIHENTAWDRIVCTPEALDYVRKSDVVCFGSLASRSDTTRNTVQTLLDHCRDETLKVLDLNLRPPFVEKRILENLLSRANVLKLNDEEITVLADMFGCPSAEMIGQTKWFLERYAFRFLILTRGAKGSVLLKNTLEIAEHPGFALAPAEIGDTVGAGDGFTAAAILGYLAGWPLDKINETANAYAAFICTQVGATPEIPERFRLLNFTRPRQ